MNKITVQFKKLTPEAKIPTYAHEGDVGMDMTATSVEYDAENDMYIYHTGLSFASDYNIGQFLFVRSSNRKTDAYLCNHVGIADSAIYRGEILFCFKNRTSLKDRIANKSNEAFFDSLASTNNVHVASNERNRVKMDLMKIDPITYAPYKVGDRIGQMVFMNYPTVELIEVEELNETVRNKDGFGSTGN